MTLDAALASGYTPDQAITSSVSAFVAAAQSPGEAGRSIAEMAYGRGVNATDVLRGVASGLASSGASPSQTAAAALLLL